MATSLPLPLAGAAVAVSGGNGNLGRAVAVRALALGARVALLDLDFDQSLPGALGADASVHRVNLLDAAATQACFDGLGPVDVLCNIAGGFTMGAPVHETDDATWSRMFDLNVRTLLNCVHAAVPSMIARGGGRIINVSAMAALEGKPLMGAYCASKAVVQRLTESMSAELKGKGINVNCVMPSVIDTPQNRGAMPKTDPALWVSPADLAEVVCFLGSPAAKAIHGASVPVRNKV